MKRFIDKKNRKVRVINKHLLNKLKRHAALELFRVNFQ